MALFNSDNVYSLLVSDFLIYLSNYIVVMSSPILAFLECMEDFRNNIILANAKDYSFCSEGTENELNVFGFQSAPGHRKYAPHIPLEHNQTSSRLKSFI